MSRICVKNIPKYVNEDRLRDFFSQKGEITDAKVMRTRDGKTRQFAFIGYRTEEEAHQAIAYFNKSFLDTCRIICEVARKEGDPNIPRPWSRYAKEKGEELTVEKDQSRADGKTNTKKKDANKSKEIDDPKLLEFLQVMQPRSNSKFWANDLVDSSGQQNDKDTEVEKISSDKCAQEDGIRDLSLIKPQKVANDDVSDMEYMKSRIRKEWSDSDSDNDHSNGSDTDQDDEENDVASLDNDAQEPVLTGEQKMLQEVGGAGEDGNEVLQTGRLFVRNLPYGATEDELADLFSKYGNIAEVHLVIDKETKRSKGFAYVLYSSPNAAARALEELDRSIFQGRLLHIIPAKAKITSQNQETNLSEGKAKTFKDKRVEDRKASEASGNTQAWNSLYMRPDTIVENIARKYGVSKSDLLDREADDLAVRIALGETQIIAETKKALENAGINVASLEELASGKSEGVKRSKHVLLVKNLPYSSTEDELSKMFGKFGSLEKIVLPPSHTLALVIFLEPAEARAAFRGLAYKRYKDAPLYLEWAPNDILSQDRASKNNMVVGEQEVKKAILEQEVEGISQADMDPDRIESRSLFVKNLNFKTTEESLGNHFRENMKEGKVLSIRIKKHMKNGKNLSMGFGFIEFDSIETATNICKDLQGTVLDGHALILQICHAKKDEKILNKGEDDRSSTKLIVRNVAFEATEKDLRQLFNPFGQIKSLRLPTKLGKHRGFAFVEFVTKQEAQNALKALSNTHLYGRHLVLERAKEGETLEELRKRTAAQFGNDHDDFSNTDKLSKKRKITVRM